jgi:uncharacterized membrane protein YvbJ
MFCPFCNHQNKEEAVFCNFCGKALPQQSFVLAANHSSEQSIVSKSSKTGFKLTDNAIKSIITAVAIVVLVLAVLVVYYPNLMHWNW